MSAIQTLAGTTLPASTQSPTSDVNAEMDGKEKPAIWRTAIAIDIPAKMEEPAKI